MFQKSPKKQTSFETAKSTLAQMALSSNQYALKVQRLEMILALTTAPKGVIKGNFSKIAKKVALASKGQQHSGANVIIL